MANILYVWELGGGYGHIGKIFYIGRYLEQQGHRVSYPVRDLPRAHALNPHQNQLLQAPLFLRRGVPLPMALNYSDVLLRCGFADPTALGGLIRGWRQLFELAKPDVVLFDHAPAAMLAATTLGIPGFNIGTGFTVPQHDLDPMPSLQPWKQIDHQALQQKDSAVLQSINQVLGSFKLEPWQRVNQLFSSSSSLLLAWPEIDHYPARGGDDYLGPVLESQDGRVIDAWAGSPLPRIFIYLSATYKPGRRLFNLLRGQPYCILTHMRDNATPGADVVQQDNLYLSARPLDLNQVMPHVDLVITHGGQTTTALTLLSGKPMLLLPQHLEQAILSYRLRQQGLATSLWAPNDETDWIRIVKSALDNPVIKNNLANFRQRYQTYDSAQTASSVVQTINNIL